MKLFETAQPILYHASFHKIRKFWPLSHFGTYRAALSRIIDVLDDTVDDVTELPEDTVLLYPVRLRCERPLKTHDMYNERPYIVGEVSTFVRKKFRKTLTTEQAQVLSKLEDRSTTPASVNMLSHLLADLGYDCLHYVNKVEDPGHVSWITLSSDQVIHLAPPLQISTHKLYQLKKSWLGTWREPQTEQMHPHQFATTFDIPDTSQHNTLVVTARHDTLGI